MVLPPRADGRRVGKRPVLEIPLKARMLSRGSKRGSGETLLPRNILGNCDSTTLLFGFLQSPGDCVKHGIEFPSIILTVKQRWCYHPPLLGEGTQSRTSSAAGGHTLGRLPGA